MPDPRLVLALSLSLAFAGPAAAQDHDPAMHHHHQSAPEAAAPANPGNEIAGDGRQIIDFPKELREHTLANMRDHLLALQQIQEAVSTQDFDKAADIAEQRLGMTSLKLHGAHEVAHFMPAGMQEIGTAMHRSASQFARTAQEAAATGDLKPVIAAMSRITANCVACHANYRVR